MEKQRCSVLAPDSVQATKKGEVQRPAKGATPVYFATAVATKVTHGLSPEASAKSQLGSVFGSPAASELRRMVTQGCARMASKSWPSSCLA